MTGSPLKGLTGLGFVYAQMGKEDKVQEILAKLRKRQKENPEVNLAIDFAVIYAGKREAKKAADMLIAEFKDRSAFKYMLLHPMWNPVRQDPYFVEKITELQESKRSPLVSP